MPDSTPEKKPRRRPSARRTIRSDTPPNAVSAQEPVTADSAEIRPRTPQGSQNTTAARRVAGRPRGSSRVSSSGPQRARASSESVDEQGAAGQRRNPSSAFAEAEPAAGRALGGEPAGAADPCGAEPAGDLRDDPAWASRMAPLLGFLYRKYFEVRAFGLEKIPASGPVVLVCNHAGPVCWDGVVLGTATRIERCSRSEPRWLVQASVLSLPFLGPFLRRFGAVPARREKAEQVLSAGEVLAVFPEDLGDDGGTEQPGDIEESLPRFSYVQLALGVGAPLVPVAMLSEQDSYPLLDRTRELQAALGIRVPAFLQRFALPDGIGVLPLPGRWRIVVGDPIEMARVRAVGEADDRAYIDGIDEQLRRAVRDLFDLARVALQED